MNIKDFIKLGLAFALLLLIVTLQGRTAMAQVNNTRCEVRNSSDDLGQFNSLRRKVVEGFNREETRACTDAIEFTNQDFNIVLKKTLHLDNSEDGDCSNEKSNYCFDEWAFILAGDTAKKVVLDGTGLPDNTCVLKITADKVWIRDVTIKVKNREDAICDEGEDNQFDVEVEPEEDDDADDDKIPDDEDNCPEDANPEQDDMDEDGEGDACDDDQDGDGLDNDEEGCADPKDPDTDHDGIEDGEDNCPCDSNPDQEDFDDDMIGDACDEDVPPIPEPTPMATPSPGPETPEPSPSPEVTPTPSPSPSPSPTPELGADEDEDGVEDVEDNCPGIANEDQLDSDEDDIGDACDLDFAISPGDDDGDGIGNEDDNCMNVANPGQEDSDGDLLGDACDTDISLNEPERFEGFEDTTKCSLNKSLSAHPHWGMWILLFLISGLWGILCRRPFFQKTVKPSTR